MGVNLIEAGELDVDFEVEKNIAQQVMHESQITTHQCHGGAGPNVPGGHK